MIINPEWEKLGPEADIKFLDFKTLNIGPAPHMNSKTICIDFDGVIHSYVSPWTDAVTIPDPPVFGAFDFINECLKKGFQVAIFSSRSHQPGGRSAMIGWFDRCDFKNTDKLLFPSEKPPAVIYIDDRAFHFKGEWPTMHFLDTFRPWNREANEKA